jgi:hypothetical protein
VFAGNLKIGAAGRGTYSLVGAAGASEYMVSGNLTHWQAANCLIGVSFRNSVGTFDAMFDPNRTGTNAPGYLIANVLGTQFTAPATLFPNAAASGTCTAANTLGVFAYRTWAFNSPAAVGDQTFVGLGRSTFYANGGIRWGYWWSANGADGAPYTFGGSTYTITPDCIVTHTQTAAGRTNKIVTVLRRLATPGGTAIGGVGYSLTTPSSGPVYVAPVNMWRSGFEPE